MLQRYPTRQRPRKDTLALFGQGKFEGLNYDSVYNDYMQFFLFRRRQFVPLFRRLELSEQDK
jgi:hypothetical protein